MSNEVLNDSLVSGVPHRPYLRVPIDVAAQNVSPTLKLYAKQLDTHDPYRFGVRLFDYSRAQADSVVDFYQVHKGGVLSWLWLDPGHSEVARQTIGTGDGADATWQLFETLTVGATSRDTNRFDIVASSVSVWVATTLKTEGVHYNVNYTTGVITFTGGNIPSGAQAIEASFTYYRRCVFPEKNGYSEVYNSAGTLINVTLRFSEVLA